MKDVPALVLVDAIERLLSMIEAQQKTIRSLEERIERLEFHDKLKHKH